jgi:hypothetical protein
MFFKKIKNIIFAGILLFLFKGDMCFSIGQITKKLDMKQNYSYLLIFDEKIIRYDFSDKNSFNVQIMPDIYNKKHELIVHPLKEIEGNFFVWTESNIYNFEISVKNSKDAPKIYNFFSNPNIQRKKDVSSSDEIDLPPLFPEKKSQVQEFEIDLPPGVKTWKK